MAMLIGVKPDQIADYKRLHAECWPEILAKISDCNITNYSIYLKEPENLLFSYWEYTGSDFAADAERMASDPRTREWWAICMPMQDPLDTRKDGEWWAMMEEVFHHD